MRSTRNVSFFESLQAELDRQFAAARAVLGEFATEDAMREMRALDQVSEYANIMFHKVWADVKGNKVFTSPLQFLIDNKDLDMLLRLREIAVKEKMLLKYEQYIAEHASPEFFDRYVNTVQCFATPLDQKDEHAIPVKAVMGSYPSLQPKATLAEKRAQLVRFHSVPNFAVSSRKFFRPGSDSLVNLLSEVSPICRILHQGK